MRMLYNNTSLLTPPLMSKSVWGGGVGVKYVLNPKHLGNSAK